MEIVEVKIVKHEPTRQRGPKSRMYFWPQGESVMENVFNRRARPYEEFRKLIPLALVEAGVPLEEARNVTARWSQRAGCSCPCSPGFILSGVDGRDFHVTVRMAFPKFQEA
jgi:hypothetical protein